MFRESKNETLDVHLDWNIAASVYRGHQRALGCPTRRTRHARAQAEKQTLREKLPRWTKRLERRVATSRRADTKHNQRKQDADS